MGYRKQIVALVLLCSLPAGCSIPGEDPDITESLVWETAPALTYGVPE